MSKTAKSGPAATFMYSRLSKKDLFISLLLKTKSATSAAMWFGVFSNLSIVVIPFYMFQMFDKVMPSQNMATLWMLFIVAFFVLLFAAYMDSLRNRVMVYVGSWIDNALGEEALSASFQYSLGSPQASKPATNYVIAIRQFFSGMSMSILMDIPWVPFFVVLIFIFNFYIGLVALIFAFILLAIALLQQFWAQPRMAQARLAINEAEVYSRGLVTNSESVESMGIRERLLNNWEAFYNRSLFLQERSSHASGALQAVSKSLRFVMMITIISVAMSQLADQTSGLGIGSMFAAIILTTRIMQPFEQGISRIREFSEVIRAFDGLSEVLAGHASARDAGMPLPAPKGHLSVENVNVIINGAGQILRNVSFKLEPGEVLGVVGASAAGKSTLGRALVGILPTKAGKVRLDGADLWTWSSNDVGKYIGYVPQQITLFEGSIADNISRFNSVAGDREILRTAKLVGLHEMIMELPHGYDTLIGPDNLILSGGQRQRIALARALYGNPVFIVLDEPNSNLDAEGDRYLLEALKIKKEQGATIVIIAHRPSVLKIADKILVMANGTVQRFGSPEEIGLLIPAPQNSENRVSQSRPAPPAPSQQK